MYTQVFTIEITKNYRQTEFREDLKGLTRQAGCLNKPTVFLFDETQIKLETFLEDVNNILTSGEVSVWRSTQNHERCACMTVWMHVYVCAPVR